MYRKQRFGNAIANALRGLYFFFRDERNARIQAVVTVLVLAAGWLAQVSAGEWMVLLFCIMMVKSLEMLNTSIERLCDVVHRQYHPLIREAKDIAAAAVLWAAAISVVLGLIIFLPKIIIR